MTSKIEINFRQYKFLTFLNMGFICSILCSVVLFTKQIEIGPFNFNGGLLTYPITYFFCDTITEVYGYKEVRKSNWCVIVWANFFSLVTTIIIRIKSPTGYFHDGAALKQVLGYDWRFILAGTIAFLFAAFLTSIIVSKMKIMLNGRMYVLRYIISVGIGEFFDTSLVFMIGLIGIIGFSKILIIIMNAYFYKLAFALILAKPADWFTKFLKKKEKCDVFDNNISYSPFKWS